MPQVILALDQGTTSSRAIVFDHAGNILAKEQAQFRQIYPQPGWVEQDPRDIWLTQQGVATRAIARAGCCGPDIAAIGIANQRETTIVWDRRSGEPVYNAIVWQDRRTSAFCDELKAAGHLPTVQAKTGLVIDAYFSASKIRWILDNVPGLRRRAAIGQLAFGTIDSWLLYRMTGLHLTDVTNASRTMLFNLHTLTWDDELLALFDVPRAMLPEVRSSSEVYGRTSAFVSDCHIPIAGVAGDQQAALFGQTCFARGLAKNTYGTGCFMLMNVGTVPIPSRHRLLTTVAWKLGSAPVEYAHEGSVFVGGAVVQWLRDGLGIIKSSAEIEPLARSVPDSGGVYLVPAFAGLGAPHWDQYARGTIVGLTRGTTTAHIARAALEGIAFQVAEVLEVMQKDAGIEITELRVDGGAAANDLLMQIQADLLGVPVIRPRVTETTALGAAYLAGLAVGFWKDRSEVEANWQVEQTFHPQMSREVAQQRRARWNRALERARDWDR